MTGRFTRASPSAVVRLGERLLDLDSFTGHLAERIDADAVLGEPLGYLVTTWDTRV